MKKDLFISHASENKDDFVRPLANLLEQYGVDVWYDEFELKIGSSISRSIDKGISNSRYGLIVLSKEFFNKNWTEYELRSFNSFEIENNDVLLPIWHSVTVNEVREFSPYMADKFALNSSNDSIEELTLKIIEVVNPELFSNIHKKIAVEKALKNAVKKKIDPKEIKPSPIRHLKFSDSIISRIRLIRASIWLGYPHSMEFWINGFQRDLNYETEIKYWERLSSCFMELITQHDINESYTGTEKNIYQELFQLLFEISNDMDESDRKKIKLFKPKFVEMAREIWQYNMPIYDIEEELPFDK